MALGHICPNRVGLGRGEQLEIDRMARGRDGGEDVVPVHALSAGRAQRGKREGIESRRQKANGAVVSEVLVHERCLGSGGS